ncbi:MAG: protoheme IX farnesyltransferase, partial [Paraglaciecola sp.]|nr:protoheme IX farnesyltransferase [Paraglaciecola sp.]
MQHERTYLRHYIPWRDYLVLCKPKVVLLLLVTAWVGMLLASHSPVITMKMLLATIGIGFAANSAAVLNHIIDSRIDAKMQRTKQRPMVNGRIRTQHALLFSFILGLTSMVLLIVYVNSLTALLTLLGIIGYACIYTMFLKHWTSQNIVFGGLAGALPPLLGWTSITDSIEFEALLLVLIIFVWTPAHFWPLAIDRVNDYQKAK